MSAAGLTSIRFAARFYRLKDWVVTSGLFLFIHWAERHIMKQYLGLYRTVVF